MRKALRRLANIDTGFVHLDLSKPEDEETLKDLMTTAVLKFGKLLPLREGGLSVRRRSRKHNEPKPGGAVDRQNYLIRTVKG